MSKSQKFDQLSIVPWANSAEWKHVFELIFGENSTREKKQEALNTIYVWKMRLNLLSSGIEGTLSILEAMLIDPETMNERQYLTLCASSIMRFLNLCVTHRSPVKSFTRTAKSNSIPDWIINIRHDIAHSHKLPGVSILKLALFECFKWLKETYWIPEMGNIKDYVIPESEADIRKLFSTYTEMVLLYNNGIDLPGELKETLRKNGVEIDDNFDWEKVLKNVLEIIDGHRLSVDSAKTSVIIDDICRGGLFNSYLEQTGKINILRKYVEAILIILAKKELLPKLISGLSVINNDENETQVIRKSVALWMNDIFAGLTKNKNQLEKVTPIKFEETSLDLINKIVNLRPVIFQRISETSEICFNSFAQLETNVSTDAAKEFLSSTKTSKCDSDKVVDTVLFQNGEVESNEKMEVDEIIEVLLKPKKRWTVITDTSAFEKLPLGVLPPL